MDLLQKFASVEVKEDTRISETDKDFCSIHQAAYDYARSALTELKFFWEDIRNHQEALLSPIEKSSTLYLLDGYDLKISSGYINTQIMTTHVTFISQIVRYFNDTYKISISTYDISDFLLPKKPDSGRLWGDPKEQEAHEKAMLELSLKYTDILEQIFIRLDGRNLNEQALHELLEKCHEAAWNRYRKEAEYVRKKAVLQFTGYACSYSARYSYSSWSIPQKMKDIFQGIAHFETGSFSKLPSSIASLIGAYDLNRDYFEFPSCQKLQNLKLYKNGRADIRFSSEEYARQFAETYLGQVC